MGMLFFLIFAAPIHMVWHPQIMHNGVCVVEPGSYAAIYCEPGKPWRRPGERRIHKWNEQ